MKCSAKSTLIQSFSVQIYETFFFDRQRTESCTSAQNNKAELKTLENRITNSALCYAHCKDERESVAAPCALPLLHQLAPCSVTPCTIFRKPPPLLSFLTRVDDRGAAAAATDVSVRARSDNVALPPQFIHSCRASPRAALDTDIHGHGFRQGEGWRRWWVNERAREEGTGEGRQAAAWPPRRRPRPAAQRPGPSCFVVRVRPRG